MNIMGGTVEEPVYLSFVAAYFFFCVGSTLWDVDRTGRGGVRGGVGGGGG